MNHQVAGLCLKSPKSFLDRVSTGSDSDLVKSWKSRIVRKYCMLITDQVAIAPCTDPIRAIPTFEAKPSKAAMPQKEEIRSNILLTGCCR